MYQCIISDEARPMAGSLISFVSYVTVFIATLTFPYLSDSNLDLWGTFTLYSVFGAFLSAITIFLVPNTKGKFTLFFKSFQNNIIFLNNPIFIK